MAPLAMRIRAGRRIVRTTRRGHRTLNTPASAAHQLHDLAADPGDRGAERLVAGPRERPVASPRAADGTLARRGPRAA
jgi:hypothetical protein